MTMIEREGIQIPVLASGKGWLAVDKPAGMSVHNEPGRDLCSLVSDFIRGGTMRERTSPEVDFGVNPVHRLDRETSGLIVLGLTREAFRFLSKQFELGHAKKMYIAILHGRLENSGPGAPWGIWDWPLGRSAGGRKNPAGPGPLIDSRTRYRVIGRTVHYTMAEIEPLSGRTHQIRRHAKLSGHHVVGDARYGSTRAINFLRQNQGFDRLALHARALTLELPDAKGPLTIETPSIPRQMLDLFQNDPTDSPVNIS